MATPGAAAPSPSSGAPVDLGQLRRELHEFRRALLQELLASLHPAGAVDAAVLVDGDASGSGDAAESLLALRQLTEPGDDRPLLGKEPTLTEELTNPKQLLNRFVSNSGSTFGDSVTVSTKSEDKAPKTTEGQGNCKPKTPARGEGAFTELGQEAKRTDLAQDEYNVHELYSDAGFLQHVARSDAFDHISLGVICINAIYIGVDANANANVEGAPGLGFQICEQLFCVFFTGEILIRFGAFRNKCDCLRDNWFRFDSTLVALMITETWLVPLLFNGLELPTAPLRLLRLFRLARLVRLLRSFPELITMIKGMWVASRAVISSLALLLIIIYVFAIVAHMVLSAEDLAADRFATLPQCMWTLLMDGILLDNTGDVFGIFFSMEDAPIKCITSTCIMLAFIGLSAITIMNMLIGILCEVVSTVAQTERDDLAISLMKSSILQELKRFDTNGNKRISKTELDHVMRSPATLDALGSLDIDVECLHELQQALFTNAEVSIENVMMLLLSYRGNLPCTVKHLLDAQVFTRWSFSEQIRAVNAHLDAKFVELAHVLATLAQRMVHSEGRADALARQVLASVAEGLPQSDSSGSVSKRPADARSPLRALAGQSPQNPHGMENLMHSLEGSPQKETL